jgi:hypothetical protein
MADQVSSTIDHGNVHRLADLPRLLFRRRNDPPRII